MRLSEFHHEIRGLAVRFIAEQLNPRAAEWEASGQFPAHEVFAQLGQLGLLGINKPVEFGGLGMDYSYQAIFAEALGALTSTGVSLAIGVQTDMATPALARYGSDELREEFLRPSISGERVAAVGLSEIGGGSDLAAIRTSARRDGDDYVINGGKMWTTNGTQADWICLLANTGERSSRSRSAIQFDKSLICVPMNCAGITVSRRLAKLGMHSSDTAQLFFDEVRVPQRFRIGSEGRGFAYQMKQFADERLSICLATIASMRDTIGQTISYTGARVTFGRAILANQAVQFRLSELFAQVEALHAHAWQTVWEYVDGVDVQVATAILKLNTGRLVRKVNDECLQLWGGMGFMDDAIVARRYRDQRLISIGGGPDEIMLRIIAGHLNLDARCVAVEDASV